MVVRSLHFSSTASSNIITALLPVHSFLRQPEDTPVKETFLLSVHSLEIALYSGHFAPNLHLGVQLHSLLPRFIHPRKGLLITSPHAAIQLLIFYIKHTSTSFVE